jgi:hypothetical protein
MLPGVKQPVERGAEAAPDTRAAIDALVDACRDRCLWWLRPDYYPRTDPERLAILEAIQTRCDAATFRRAGALRTWLSRPSSGASAAC